MKILTVKRTNQNFLFFMIDSKIRIFVDKEDYGTILNGELKEIKCDNNHPVIRFDSAIKKLELHLSLKEDNQIEIFWKKSWGNIGFKDQNQIVTSIKKEIRWRNYLLALIFLVAILALLYLYLGDMIQNAL